MNEHVRRDKGIWIALGALVLIGLCLTLCFGTAAFTMMHRGPAYGAVPYVQPPAGEEGGTVPPAYYGPGFFGRGGHGGFSPFGFLFFGIGMFFKLLFFGLILFLLIGFVKWFFHSRHLAWYPPYWGKPPEGKEGENNSQFVRGPWNWHRHPGHWGPFSWRGPTPEPGDEEGEPTATEGEPDSEPDAAEE